MTSALLVALAATATAFAPTATPASRFGARTVKAATLASAERLNYYNSLSLSLIHISEPTRPY